MVLKAGWGDAVPAAQAGLLEIADVYVVNKADRPGAKDTVRELKSMLQMSTATWKPPIVETVAVKGEGIEELWEAVRKHREYQAEAGILEARRRRRVEHELREIVAEKSRLRLESEAGELLQKLTDAVCARDMDPYAAADELMAAL